MVIVVSSTLGNCRTGQIASLMRNSQKVILAFSEDEEKSILPLP